jgi:hypothetical protein
MTSRALLAASAALPLLAAAAAAHATTVATFPIEVSGSAGIATIEGSGSGVLSGTGTFTVNLDETITIPDFTGSDTTAMITETGTFFGSISGGVFSVTSGTGEHLSCADEIQFCQVFAPFTSVSGSFSASAGGTITGTFVAPLLFGGLTSTETYTVPAMAPAPAVPLPPAVWLFGSGLLGVIGASRCRPRRPSA